MESPVSRKLEACATRNIMNSTLPFRGSIHLAVLFLAWMLNGLCLLADDVVDQSAVRKWIVRLDADRKADRTEAKEKLLQMGPAVLQWLPEPESLASRSAKEAVRNIRTILERQQAERSVQANRLTVSGPQLLSDLIPQLSQDTGNMVVAEGLSKELLAKTLRLPEQATFWTVLESLRDQLGVVAKLEGSPARVRLFARDAIHAEDCLLGPELASAQSKAFRVSLRSAKPRNVIGTDPGRLMRIELEVSSEPRIRPLFLKGAADDLRITSAALSSNAETNEERWRPFAPETKLELTFGQGHRQVVMPVDFRLPVRSRFETVSLSGKMLVQTAAAEVAIEFPAGAESRGVARRRGGVTVKVLNWSATSEPPKHSLEVMALVSYDSGGPAFESHRSWMLFNIAGLVRAGMMPSETIGSPKNSDKLVMLKPQQIDSDVQPDGSIAVTYRFTDLPLPASEYRFRYVAPTMILDVPVDFEMRDVKLPK